MATLDTSGQLYKYSIVHFQYCPLKIINPRLLFQRQCSGRRRNAECKPHCPKVFRGVMLSLIEKGLMHLAIGQINTQNSQYLCGNKRMKEFITIHFLNPHCATLLHIQNICSSVKRQPGISSSVQPIKERKTRNGYMCNSSRSLIKQAQIPENTMEKEPRKKRQ